MLRVAVSERVWRCARVAPDSARSAGRRVVRASRHPPLIPPQPGAAGGPHLHRRGFTTPRRSLPCAVRLDSAHTQPHAARVAHVLHSEGGFASAPLTTVVAGATEELLPAARARMSTCARARLRRVVATGAVSTLAVVGAGCGVALRLGYEADRQQLSQQAQASASNAAEPVLRRHASKSLARLLARRVHMLLVGPTGCGKTTAVLDAARASAFLGDTVLLPFYVNLGDVMASGGGGKVAAADGESCSRIVAAFAAVARAFEGRLLRVLSDDFAAWAWVKLSQRLPDALRPERLSTLKQIVLPPTPHQATSLYGLLAHVAQAGTQQAALHAYAHGALDRRLLVPVIIIDEVHLLRECALEPVRQDLLRFVQFHVADKQRAAVTVVLLSSDASAAELVGTCACRARAHCAACTLQSSRG